MMKTVKKSFLMGFLFVVALIGGNMAQAQGPAKQSVSATSDFKFTIAEGSEFQDEYLVNLVDFEEEEVALFCEQQSNQLVRFSFDPTSHTMKISFPSQPEGAVSLGSIAEQNWYLDIRHQQFLDSVSNGFPNSTK
ncbi:MAG: hypothetical protein H6581_29905 [Bacteroidia bacterium]|nr:hypothetical protein [Bacteroidia bacterium]